MSRRYSAEARTSSMGWMCSSASAARRSPASAGSASGPTPVSAGISTGVTAQLPMATRSVPALRVPRRGRVHEREVVAARRA